MADSETVSDERFEFEAYLGSGAMGAVYRVHDKARGMPVALKLLKRVTARSLFHFKAEFRSLANLSHPNLLQLYELVTRGDDWLLTMELVNGTDFLSYVRPGRSQSHSPVTTHQAEADDSLEESTQSGDCDRTADDSLRDSMPAVGTGPGASAGQSRRDHTLSAQAERVVPRLARARHNFGPLDETRLRTCLRQIAQGLHALHAKQFLHRDLKPDNVLVFADTGRVVICDFGLVVETKRTGTRKPANDVESPCEKLGPSAFAVAGTVAFMSPEQAAGRELTPAADWYAVGVMLYLALTLRLPIEPHATWEATLLAKQQTRPPDPRTINPDAPADLSELALALLAADPSQRAGYPQVAADLAQPTARNSRAARANDLLLGREREMARLQTAFARAREGELAQVFVSGLSGMGKSALLRHFLHSAETDAGALVLSSRCYEREELPYKAFDPLVDALSSYLLGLDEAACTSLLPEQLTSLAAMFPTLCLVPAIAARTQAQAEDRTLLERRNLAADALYELCRRISQRQPLILYIDDLQWGDLDSAVFFARFVPGADASLLLMCAYRSEDHARSPLLGALRATHAEHPVIDVKLDALTHPAATQLARALLPAESAHVVEQIVREACGSPFFVGELASFVRERGRPDSPEDLRLERVVTKRLDALNSECRLMLDLAAVAGRPERRSVMEAAAELGAQSFGALHTLELQCLVQIGGVGANARVEPYHDRIRETAYGALGSERRVALHRRLAEVLQQVSAPENDAEALFRHWKAAGEPSRASVHALVAAESAERSLAFSRAADLYAEAAQLVDRAAEGADQRSSDLHERRAQALRLARRSAEAARSFSDAADHCDGDRAKALRVRSQVELLRSGHMDEALDGLARHADTTGVALPKSELAAIGMLLARRMKIRLTRSPQRRAARHVPSAVVAHIDRLWEISTALSSVDFLRGSLYTAELTLRALQAGGARPLAFAYAMECIAASAEGRQQAYKDYAARAMATSDATTDPLVQGAVGVARFLRGDWAAARELTQASAALHRRNPVGSWDLATMKFWDLAAATQLGELADLVREVPEAARDADERGDLFASIYFRSLRSTWAWLAPDQPMVAREQLRIAEQHLLARGYLIPHYYLTLATSELDLYEGKPQESLRRVEKEWALGKVLRTIEHPRCELHALRARLCIEQARQRFEPKLLRQARSDVRALTRISAPWAVAHATLLQASLASADARPNAVVLLEAAEQRFTAVGMKLHASVARMRRGQLIRGAAGAALRDQAEGAIRACGVTHPMRFARMLAPGLGYDT